MIERKYYRLLADVTLNGVVYFEAGSCVVDNWLPGLRLPESILHPISAAEGRDWFKADEERARRAREAAVDVTRCGVVRDMQQDRQQR